MKFRTLFAIAICLSSNCLFADTPTDAPLLPDNQPVLQHNATLHYIAPEKENSNVTRLQHEARSKVLTQNDLKQSRRKQVGTSRKPETRQCSAGSLP